MPALRHRSLFHQEDTMHFTHLRAAALLALAAAALGACERLPSDAGVPHEAAPSASTGVSAPEPDALAQDAEVYATRYHVSVDEALWRLRLQQSVGNLNADLQANYPETFAGLVIEHEPEYRVVARFTRGGAEALQAAVRDPGLAAVVREEHAPVPLRRMQARLESAFGRVRARGIRAAGGLNLRQNRPEIYVLAPAAAAARAAIPVETGAAVLVVEQLPAPEALLYGGLPISTCTTGFYVKNASGTPGVTTAGHCGNSQSYGSTALTFLGESYSGSYDIQWHNHSGSTYDNIIKVGTTTRSITGTRFRASQTTGEYVCKQGKTTGNTCGLIDNTSYCESSTGACTWVHVSGGSVNLSEPGDSGGPWFSGNIAYGSHVFGWGNDSGYLAVDYFSGIGVTVVTFKPLSVTISGPSSLQRFQSLQYTATAANGTSPYTYEWRSRDGWQGSYGAWSSWFSTGSTNTTYASVNSCGIDRKELEVRATDAASTQATSSYTIFVSNPC
jgi:hypothetical protein